MADEIARRVGSTTDDPDPYRLKKNTLYLLRFTNDSGGAIAASIKVLCVEKDS